MTQKREAKVLHYTDIILLEIEEMEHNWRREWRTETTSQVVQKGQQSSKVYRPAKE